jgi:hypothetical protein
MRYLTSRLALITGGIALILIVIVGALCLTRGNKDPDACLQSSLHGPQLTAFAKDLEEGGAIAREAGFKCRGIAGLFQSQKDRELQAARLTRALVASADFRFGLYEAHVLPTLPGARGAALRPILESLDQLTQDLKALASCPLTGPAHAADYEGLTAPLISAMLLRSSLPLREGNAGKIARDLSKILNLAQGLPNFPPSSCAEAPRYFTAMDAFIAGIHPLAKDCKPGLEGTEVVLDCNFAH